MLWCSVVVVSCNMCRTGMCRFGIGNWIFLLAALNLFTYAQGGEDTPQDEGIQFTIEPSDAVAGAGVRVVLACGAGGRGAPVRISWRHSEQAAPTRDHGISAQDKYRKQLSNGSLVIESMSASLAGQYQCVATSDVGTIVSRVAAVYLAELPELIPGPRSVLGIVGGPVLLPCGLRAPPRLALKVPTAAGPPDRRVYGTNKLHLVPPTLTLNVTWLKNGLPLRGEGARVTLTASGALEIDPARAHDAAVYRCQVAVANQPHLYKSGEEIELRINAEVASTEYPPRFIATPQPITVIEGASVTFDCAAVGNPKPEIIWLNNGVAIDLSDLDSRFYLVGSGSLRVQSARALDAGAYTCRAHNRLDSADHTTQLQVLTAPRVQLASRAAAASTGGDVTLRCSVRGRPTPKVTWLKDGEPLTPNDHDIALVDGASLRILGGCQLTFDSASLRILGVLGVDAGMWQCCAVSLAGSATAALRLTVTPPRKDNNKNVSSFNPKSILHSLKPQNSNTLDQNLATSQNSQDIFNTLLSNSDQKDFEYTDSDFLGETSPAFTNHEVEYDDNYEYNQLDSDDDDDSFHAAKEMDLDELKRSNSSVISAPTGLKAVIIKHRFVTLSWEEPETSLEEIKGYAVVYKVKGSERERVARGSASKHEMNVASLQPNTTYQFAVIAYTEHAASPPTETIEVRTPEEELSYGPPRDVRAEAVGPHAIRVSWAPPLTGHPTKYAVYYTEAETGREQFQWVDMDPSTSAMSTTVAGVRAAAAYWLRVAAAGGAPSPEVRVRTPTDVPAAPPANVTAVSTGAATILVSWEAPPSRTHRGPLTGYKVRYRPLSTPTSTPTPNAGPTPAPRRKAGSLTTPADARRAELRGLDTGTTYQIRVCAMNANGSGPFSEWVTATTQRHHADETRVPPQPPPLTTRGGRDWVSVWWGGGAAEGAAVRGYSLGWGLGVPDEHARELPAHTHSHVITGLEPNAEYVISLRASNALGLGPAVYATVRTKPAAAEGDDLDEEDEEPEEEEDDDEEAPPLIPPVGLKVIMLSGTTAVVYWTDPTLPKGQTATDGRRYVVRWSGGGRTRTFNASDLNCMLDDLKPATTYEFAVKLIKGGRESAWSMLVSNTTLEAPPASPPRELRVSPPAAPANPARSADLHWQPPAKPNGVITGYVITYAVRGSEEWTAVSVGAGGAGGAGRARVDRLRARTTYLFKVQARNGKGLGPFTQPVHYTTPMESGDGGGGGLATATSAWLWASAGGACAVLALAAALALSLCCRRSPPSPPHDSSTYQKASASAPVPPDLWIHHDQMELKHLDRPPQPAPLHSSNTSSGEVDRSVLAVADVRHRRQSPISASSCDGRDGLMSSTLTLRAPPAEYEPARHPPHPAHPPHPYTHPAHVSHPASLDRRMHVPTYVAMTGVGVGVGVGSMSSMSGMATLPSDRRCARADQTPLLAGMAPLGSPQSSMASLHPPPAPCGSVSCPLGAACSVMSAAPPHSGHPHPGMVGTPAGGDIYACAARERGHYVAYEPLGHYTHRDSLSSDAGTAGADSGAGGAGSGSGGGHSTGGGAGAVGGSLQRGGGGRHAPLHSFSDASDHSTPSHSNRSVRECSPYKKSGGSSPGHTTNRLHLGSGIGMLGGPDELEPLQPSHSHSTERLQQEVHTLEGLMKDLSKITQQQFHC